MPQLDFYSFYYQNITIVLFFFIFYFIFIKVFLISFSKITKFRSKIINSCENYKTDTLNIKSYII